MSINRKIRRNKKNPMVDEYVELSSKNLFSDKNEDITLYSYNRNYLRGGQDLLIRFSIYMFELLMTSTSDEIKIFTYVDFFETRINNINKDNRTLELDYEVENDRITYDGKLVGLNLGKLLIGKYIIYFAGPNLFFEDTDTQKKYTYFKEMAEGKVA